MCKSTVRDQGMTVHAVRGCSGLQRGGDIIEFLKEFHTRWHFKLSKQLRHK